MIKRTCAYVIITVFLVLCLSQSGCGARNDTGRGGAKIIAKINKYELTTEDFKDNASMVHDELYAMNREMAKNQLLEELIIKNVLLQEAQEQNFDKDKAFMKEIQGYWEQALLKLLIKKKTKEIAAKVTVRDSEVREEYEKIQKEKPARAGSFKAAAPSITEDIRHRKVAEALKQWVESLRRNAHITIYKDNLRDVEI